MSSHFQDVPYRCEACGHDGERPTWLVIDPADRPDLVDELRAGRLRTFPCDACAADVTRTTSLLVLADGSSQPLFAPDPTADARLTQEQLMVSLITAYRDQDLTHLPAVLPISHELLPTAAGRAVDADLDAWTAGTWTADSDELQRYGEWLAETARTHHFARIKDAVATLTTVTNAAEFREVVRSRPELLSEDADDLLRAMQHVAEEEEAAAQLHAIEQWRHLLRLCRRDGVDETLGALRDE